MKLALVRSVTLNVSLCFTCRNARLYYAGNIKKFIRTVLHWKQAASCDINGDIMHVLAFQGLSLKPRHITSVNIGPGFLLTLA